MLYVSVWTGLRVSELIGLKWRCIHADSITVEERFSRGDWSVPKTQASAATIGVSPEVISPHPLPEDSLRKGSGGACDANTQAGQSGGSGRSGLSERANWQADERPEHFEDGTSNRLPAKWACRS